MSLFRKRTTLNLRCLTMWLSVLLASSPAWGAPVIIPTPQGAANGLACIGTRNGSNLGCTAKEFTVNSVFSAAPGTPPFCVAGGTFEFLVQLELSGSNADRYDIGFYVGESYNYPELYDPSKLCSVAAFPTSPSPYVDLDNNGTNSCGDYTARGDSIITINKLRVACTSDGTTGALSVPYTLTYDQNGGNPACNGSNPSTLPIPTTSKCQSGASTVSGSVAVFSGAYVDVTKQTAPDGDSQTFTYTATGPAGSKVIALTGSTTLSLQQPTDGTYTPATIAAATNSTTVTLTDGQTARFYINALSTGQTITITEAATTNWENSAAIACAPVTGSPTLTTNNATRTMTANLNSTNSAAACTITNTKRARLTLAKSVAGRLNAADQFTVSASGGGTLTGTTSATTAGSGTSASTTFYSTPNVALTLADVKAAGPTPLTSYETSLTCTNAFTGPGATPNAGLPNGLSTASTSITPAPGDDITCTYTNTPKLTLTKAFGTGLIGAGRPATLTYTIANPAGAPARTGGITFTDTFPANLVIAGTPAVVNNCGGTPTVTAAAGTGTFIVGGSGLNAAAGASTCTISVDVTSLTPLSGYVNGAAQITAFSDSLLNGVTNQTLNVVQASLTKAFSPTTIDQGETATLTFTLTNGAGNPAQSGIGFTDTLPASVMVSAVPNITTTCPSGTGVVTAAAGAGTIVVTGATMNNAQTSCAITVDVTSNAPGGPYDNTSASISGTARLTNSVITSGLTVRAKPTLTKAFSSGTIGVGQPATLTFTITNPAGAPARTGLTFTDTFPANLVIAGTPNVVNNCGGAPTITATAGGGTFTVGGTGVNAAAGASTCTISVDVTSLTPLSGYLNGAAQISAISGKLLNGVTNQTLNVVQAALTKGFSPTSIAQGETSTLTFTLANGAGNPPQTGINFTDTLPATVTVAATPNITTTCPSGTGVVTAAAGAGSIVVTGAAMSNAQAFCIITVDVTSNTPGGPYNNTSASISGTARVTNNVTASSLSVQAKATITIVKQSNGGTGSFSFSGGTNGLPANLTLDTATGNPKSSLAYTVTADGLDTAITETVPAQWALTNAICSDGSTTFGSLSGGVLTIAAAHVVAGKNITCTFTNTRLMPNIVMVKSAQSTWDPVNFGTNPKNIPGARVRYTIQITNFGPGAVDAGSVVITDAIPPDTALYVAGAPIVDSSDGSPASGFSSFPLPVTFYDGSNNVINPPVAGGDGTDPAVKSFTVRPAGPFNPASGGNNPSFSISYVVVIK
jgi:trimeric autotransporter adhesin